MIPFGVKIIESIHLTKPIEDWSEVRSPSRAARRRRQGHPQRIRIIHVPDPALYLMRGIAEWDPDYYVGHPETVRELMRQMPESDVAEIAGWIDRR